jgi:predicted porin
MNVHAKLALIAVCSILAVPAGHADDTSDLKAQLQALQKQMDVLQLQITTIAAKVEQAEAPQRPTVVRAALVTTDPLPVDAGLVPASVSGDKSAASAKHGFFERKSGSGLTFYTKGGELTVYSKIDVSLDNTTKGISGLVGPDGNPPIGGTGWLPAISTNMSYIGIRGFETLGGLPFNFVYQLETQMDISATAGTSETNSSESDAVKGALTSRDSFVGLASPSWGAIRIGKTFAPYRTATDRMNPFSGMIGDYQVIMGNTGGDNRVEFGTRLDHSIWYESPNWGGFTFTALVSPGQNWASDNDNIAAGESDCTGGNVAGSGGITPVNCSDGSFGTAVSASMSYSKGALYIAAAYERHQQVNRESDITGIYGSANPYSMLLEAQDIADEDAGKIGVQYTFPSKTTVSGIFETMHRYVPADLEFQNERQRNGTWLAVSQQLNPKLSLHLGWAHAFRTPGDPGQHNDSFITPPGGVPGTDYTAGAGADNRANMFTVALKRRLSENLSVYADWAMTANGPAAHYDLGAGGRGVTTDCHDASDATGGLVASNPHCWTGPTLMGVSIGTTWRF